MTGVRVLLTRAKVIRIKIRIRSIQGTVRTARRNFLILILILIARTATRGGRAFYSARPVMAFVKASMAAVSAVEW